MLHFSRKFLLDDYTQVKPGEVLIELSEHLNLIFPYPSVPKASLDISLCEAPKEYLYLKKGKGKNKKKEKRKKKKETEQPNQANK